MYTEYLAAKQSEAETEFFKSLNAAMVVDALSTDAVLRTACRQNPVLLDRFIQVIEAEEGQFNLVVIFTESQGLPTGNNHKPVICRVGRDLKYQPRSIRQPDIGFELRASGDRTVKQQFLSDSNRESALVDIQRLLERGCIFKFFSSHEEYFAYQTEIAEV